MKMKIKSVMSSPDYKVISVSGETGDVLERHKVNEPAILLVKKGTVSYQEEDKISITLKENEGQNIPAEIFHELRCLEAAEVFLLIPQKAKMKFQK